MEAPSAEPALPDMPAAAPETAPPAAPPSPARTPTKYPAMMQSGGAALASVPLDDDATDADLGPMAPPKFLVPPTVTSAADVQTHQETFDRAFAPLASLTADDVVVGCAAHGAEYLSSAQDHLGRFKEHVRAVDVAHGPTGVASSLEAGELAQLPVAAAKGCVGLSLYSTATVARFTPVLLRALRYKMEEWRVFDKAAAAKEIAVAKAKEVGGKAAEGVKKGWKWLKAKIDEKRNGAGLPLAEAPKQ